jgi:hypothetical protein
MNATDVKYNPYHAATSAAFAELSSEQAQRFYSLKAQEDILTVLDASVTLFCWVYQLAELTYAMGAQCRAWCNERETNAQSTALAMPILATVEDPWEVEADYEFVEFSPYVVAQANASSMLLLAPASTMVCESVWSQTPKDMRTEVEWIRAATVFAPAEAELTMALDVPGATGGKQRKSRAKASISKNAAAKPKGARARAGAKGGK